MVDHKTEDQRILDLLHRFGVLRASDIRRQGIHDAVLTRLVKRGEIQRAARGVYVSAGIEPSDRLEFAVAKVRVPHGVVCLLSALAFHELTTQLPREVWMAVDWTPVLRKGEWPPIRFTRYSGVAFREGRMMHAISPTQEALAEILGMRPGSPSEGISVSVYSPAKTVADCFKFRNKIGLDVAMEALRDALQKRKATRDEIWHYAEICRVQNVIRPYLEANA